VLGAILAILSAASFALNNAAARRAVVTGTPTQGMALTVPIGVVCFLVVAALTGEVARLGQFPRAAAAWMMAVGLLHFVVGRYCNYRANQYAGANLTGPVIQLQVLVTLALAVIVLNEPCTALQVIGGLVMLSGSFIAQSQQMSQQMSQRVSQQMSQQVSGAVAAPRGGVPASPLGADRHAMAAPKFVPRQAEGYLFALLAACAYGTTPIMVRTALRHGGPSSAILGGVIAYGAATAAIALMLMLSISLRRNVMALRRDNMAWFAYSGVFVAMAQGFLYAAVAVAPIMLVMPLLQLALVFRIIFATLLNPEHEVFGAKVIAGSAISVVGACVISIDTDLILGALGLEGGPARLLRWHV
jgi:drug/metabolite transporter (DMT)-like permease